MINSSQVKFEPRVDGDIKIAKCIVVSMMKKENFFMNLI